MIGENGMKKNLLMYGIGSFKNHGCEAIVNGTINHLDKSKYSISLACHDIDYNSKYYVGLIDKYIKHSYVLDELNDKDRADYCVYVEDKKFYEAEQIMYKSVIDEVSNHDLFISAGGDNYSYGYSYWLYAIHDEVKKKGKKSVLWGASLYDKLVDPELINDLRKYDLLLLRESISYEAAREYIDESKLMLAPDPAFSLVPKKVELNNWYKKRDIVAINVSPLTIKNDEQYAGVVKFINYLLDNTKYSVLLLPHVLIDGCSDLDVLNKLKEEFSFSDRVYLEDNEYDCGELKYVLSQCKIAIAGRTHASIAAYSSFVPTIVIGYSVKSRGIAKDLFGTDSIYVIPNEIFSYESLLDSFNYIVDNYKNIKGILEDKCSKYRETSANLMNIVEERLDLNEKKTICSKEKCSGCGACFKSCPKGAIVMKEDENGFLYPDIDLDKCIHCDRCRVVCPVLNLRKNKCNPLVYAAKNKDVEVQKNSSSGGIFSILANYIFDKKGVVYGVVLDKENYFTKHVRCTKKDELVSIRGSKYTQSSVFEVFELVKKDLDSKREVLFSGTPCQIAGLKHYLVKDYSNLFTVSVVCHGVTSNKLFEKYLKEINLDIKISSNYFKFKDSRRGWSVSKVSYKTDYRSVVEPFRDNPFMYLYVNNHILRESCYNCAFKGIENQKADIILGDYWGIGNYHEDMFDENGVSCVIVLTDNGKKIIKDKKVKESLIIKKSVLENVAEGNPLLMVSPKMPVQRDVTLNELKNNSFELVSKNFKLADDSLKLYDEVDKLKHDLVRATVDLDVSYQEKQAIINSKGWRALEKIRRIIRRR